ncbi:MAG TPA: host-nuclease inhibitor Gam family protein [Opitutaceae bacterium]|jgi:phage host-nuclease inhibitor protein Gam
MSKRIKDGCLTTRTDFERVIDQICVQSNDLQSWEALRDAELQRVRENHDEGARAIVASIKALRILAEQYATEHREELLPDKAKSATTALATYGFRLGMPALKTLSKKTWAKVLVALKADRAMTRFIRTKEEVDKAKLIAAATMPAAKPGSLSSAALSELGCRVAQEESFFIEPKDTATAHK